MLIVDTGVLVAAADRSDPDHDACALLVESEPGPLVTSPLVIAEAAYLLGRQLGATGEATLLRAVAAEEILMDQPTAQDLKLMADLVEQYGDLGLGATDASVVVLAGRHRQTKIATLDHRHFNVVRPITGDAFTLVP